MSLGQRMILTNIVLSTFPRKEIQSLGQIVSLLFSRLTGPEQAGLKCSVWFEATAKIENRDFTSLTAHHRIALM